MKVGVVVILIYVVGVIAVYIYSFGIGFSENHQIWRTFSTYFSGLLGPLLSFAALMAVLYGLFQSESLNRLQAVENNIIKQIEFHRHILDSLSIPVDKKGLVRKTGRDVFEHLFEMELKNRYKEAQFLAPSESDTVHIEISFATLFGAHGGQFGYYFRNLYRVIKYIDEVNNEKLDKDSYVKLLRAQLSKYEILMLFYNCQSSKGSKKFKPYVEKYALLKEVEHQHLIEPTHWNLYKKSAYGISNSEA